MTPPLRERAYAVVALIVLMRTTVLFVRQHTAGRFAAPIAPIWQDDGIIRTAFVAVEAVALVLVARRWSWRRGARDLALLAVLGWSVVSVAWSVEPGTTQLRAGMFVGTAVVGWWFGTRFTAAAQARLVALACGLTAVASLLAAARYDEARGTNGVDGLWSGVFVNRNSLGAVMALGVLATALAIPSLRWMGRVTAAAAIALETFLFWQSDSRTGVVALAAAAGVAGALAAIRVLRRRHRSIAVGVASAGSLVALGGLAVHLEWDRLLDLLGRGSTLTRRTEMWAIDRDYIALRPWRGYGFEAIWTNQPIIDEASARFGAYPYQAHSGYYELLLDGGRIGFALFLAFTAVVLWRSFATAWWGDGLASLWPAAVAAYVLVSNFSEAFFVSNDIQWVLLVAAGCARGGLRPSNGQRRAGRASTAS